MTTIDMNTVSVLQEVGFERARQTELWGQQDHPWIRNDALFDWWKLVDLATIERDAHELVDTAARRGIIAYFDILMEEVVEAAEAVDISDVREELVQIAAVAVAAIESIDRNGA